MTGSCCIAAARLRAVRAAVRVAAVCRNSRVRLLRLVTFDLPGSTYAKPSAFVLGTEMRVIPPIWIEPAGSARRFRANPSARCHGGLGSAGYPPRPSTAPPGSERLKRRGESPTTRPQTAAREMMSKDNATLADSFPGTEEGAAARLRIDQAASAVTTSAHRVPADLVNDLFERAAPEDVARYAPHELARLAQSAWSFMAVRAAGAPKLRFENPQADGGDEWLASASVLEIINDDMPFLVDSVMGQLSESGVEFRLVAHPVFTVERDAAGRLTGFQGAQSAESGRAGAVRESFIHIHVERIADEARRAEIVKALTEVLADVRSAVHDWRAMMARVNEDIAELQTSPPPLPVEDIAETIQFLEWLVAGNFTFLGVRDNVLSEDGDSLEPRFETGLGLLRSREVRVLRRGYTLLEFTPDIMAFLQEPRLLIVAKAALRSRVHRRAHMDYIGIKRFDSEGRLIGELRIIGLFTSTAYTHAARSIPYLRRKVAAVIARAGFDPEGHSGKALANILETYSRDELFQIDEDTLYQFALAILRLEERPRVRVLARQDRFDRFVSILVYVPRDRYDSEVRKAIGDYFARVYNGRVSAFYPSFTEGPLVRVHFIIGRWEGETPTPERATLERGIEAIIRTWIDGFGAALTQSFDPHRARTLFERYRDAFSDAYREAYPPATAVADLRLIEGLTDERPLGVDFHPDPHGDAHCAGLKVWNYGQPIPLSDRVPVLENMGFSVVDERTYEIDRRAAEQASVWLHDMTLTRADGAAIDLEAMQGRLEACFLVVMRGGAENDGYNALVLAGGLMWREVALIRAISRFLRQIRVPFSQDYLWTTLVKHAGIAAQIVDLFRLRFDPHIGDESDGRRERTATALAEIETALATVESLDEDRILRHFVNAVQAALRTNFYQVGQDGQPNPLIAIKFASRRLDGVPLPRPLYEIFVYSPRVEGVHLRFGKVARGGIRWSDRPQDFRTEILGLVKAQQVKNAVIVPVGAKGGFVPKHLVRIVAAGGAREAIQAEGTAAYRLFIDTLLDITDNLGADGVIPPASVVRHDDDDPYLVVAADKGTATFSDLANSIASEHDFWLGDAFASGGSAGYDHKKMGITARGAWEAVKRHFREMDVDISTTPFTVAGVGDMSGDVFGNGALRETTTRLVAAFDHRDIFIDPNPDPKKSFAERKRLFELPRSSWQDYDKALISQGGGVFSRKAKEISLAPEAQTALGLDKDKVTPHEAMKAILQMPVDLLFFGGIGTFVRASGETNEEVGDRANDLVRVTGADLNCKVIGEGANLGMTQRGRVEAALRGVRLNTDAIDNSAGVNTSDVEVNIKIALARPLRDGRLSEHARNALLAEMTEDVAALVLRNNYMQTLALSLTERRGLEDLGFQQRTMQFLEARGLLDRAVEYLPDEMELAERRRRAQPLTRPELAVLLAYAKLALNDALLESSVPDDPYLGVELTRYFPQPVVERFPDALEQHRLRREIIATQLANSMINRAGPTLIVRIADQTGASAAAIAAAFAAVRNSFEMPALNAALDALDNKIAGETQLALYADVQDLLLDRLVWFLRNVDLSQGLAAIVAHYRAGIAAVDAVLDRVLAGDAAQARVVRTAELVDTGVPEPLARRIAGLPVLAAAPDIVLVAERTGQRVEDVAATYFAAERFFHLDRIAAAARTISVSDYFDRLALDRALDSIGDAERRLTAAMAESGATGDAAVEAWVEPRRDEIERIRAAVTEIANSGLTLSKLAVAASLLGDLVRR
jgi:glutamate dehydrogenase